VSGNNLTGNHGPVACNYEDFDTTSSGELPDKFNSFGQQDLPGNEELTNYTPSLSSKIFPSIKSFLAGDLLAGDLQVSQLLGQQQVLLQDAHHEQQVPFLLQPVDLENSSYQVFEEEIIFLNGSKDASPDTASDDIFDLDSVLWVEQCLPFDDSLYGHHGNLFVQPMINDYAEVFLEDCVKQENCALTVTGAITKLHASRKSIAMAAKLLASDFPASTEAFALVP